MTITLVETPGSSSANTLGTLAEANAYFAERAGGDKWAVGDETKKAALVTAARNIAATPLIGDRVNVSQTMAFPRTRLYWAGQPVDATTVPAFAKWAQFEEALAIISAMGEDLDVDPLAPTGLEQFTALAVGDIRLDLRDPTPENPSRTLLSPLAFRLLAPFFYVPGDRASVRNVRILRGG